MYRKYFKRLFDIIFSIILILLLFPIMVFIFFLVWIFIGFPIFAQKRPGLNNKIFILYKFKTLYDSSKYVSENKRRNKVGNFLRKTGLDELPQLFNILENNMSFVGPRPLLIEYLKINAFRKHERSKCKPGVTGLAQIQIFNNLIVKRRSSKWEEQFFLDKKYYRDLGFRLDMIILVRTFLKALKSKKIDYYKETKLLAKYVK